MYCSMMDNRDIVLLIARVQPQCGDNVWDPATEECDTTTFTTMYAPLFLIPLGA